MVCKGEYTDVTLLRCGCEGGLVICSYRKKLLAELRILKLARFGGDLKRVR